MGTKNRFKKKAKITGVFGTVSGTGSIISVHNVCHALCLAVVAFLSVFGVIASSDILMFLENYNLFFWSMGIFFLALGLMLLLKYPNCMSRKMILANSGLLIIGVPYLPSLNLLFWIVGSIIVSASIGWYIKDKFIVQVNQIEKKRE